MNNFVVLLCGEWFNFFLFFLFVFILIVPDTISRNLENNLVKYFVRHHKSCFIHHHCFHSNIRFLSWAMWSGILIMKEVISKKKFSWGGKRCPFSTQNVCSFVITLSATFDPFSSTSQFYYTVLFIFPFLRIDFVILTLFSSRILFLSLYISRCVPTSCT